MTAAREIIAALVAAGMDAPKAADLVTRAVVEMLHPPDTATANPKIRDKSGWSALRNAVLERDAGVCSYCCDDADHVDHIIPVCQGGRNDMANLAAACRPCNLSKGGLTLAQWCARDGIVLPPWFYREHPAHG